VKESHLGLRVLLTVLVVVCLITADLHFNSLGKTRSALNTVATPILWVADIPARARAWYDTHVRSRAQLLEDNARLQRENLLLQGRSMQMSSLQAENVRLRGLLNSTAMLRNDVLVAELIGVSPDPVRHQLVLNKGARDGVYEGQPLIDADGLMGQVVEVSEFTSRVLLLTDVTHSIPVQVNRNGIRAIAEGTGSLDAVEVHHVSATTDIQEGDLLVSSGLGGRFPVGYPVAEVALVERDPGQPFARILARPRAALNRTRHVLLVFVGEPEDSAVSTEPEP
jgi:rod shape-determining protein MreC